MFDDRVAVTEEVTVLSTLSACGCLIQLVLIAMEGSLNSYY